MKLHLVDDGVPTESVSILAKACNERTVEFCVHDANDFVFAAEARAAPGEMLFRPAISNRALKIEQHLFQEGVATFYAEPKGVYFSCNNENAMFQNAGIPTPRSFFLTSPSREALDFYVEQLGGFPVVLKVPGHSGGVGVMKLDSPQALYSVVDYVSYSGQLLILSAFIDDAHHWRCVVVGDRVVASYLNPPDGEDFRTYGTTDPNKVFSETDPDMEALAVAAVHILGLRFGGVDILQHPSGRLYVLEANFPCYFAHAQKIGGIDVAGCMVDYLVENVKRLGRARNAAD